MMELLISRNDSIQLEKELPRGKTGYWKISWLNDCEYSLELLYKDLKDSRGNIIKKGSIKTFEIIKATSSYYIFQQKFAFIGGYSDTLWRKAD